ncbi:MAG: efflux transporter outer membrane subunit [Verrucomicrobiae bacterium]|nr:efflux transporter outer membrane subunit [Verrucomicrobiae bacterium]NNJ43745.1 efflux transporter outer membrane subunit [Akkermansiaceae bacterium]
MKSFLILNRGATWCLVITFGLAVFLLMVGCVNKPTAWSKIRNATLVIPKRYGTTPPPVPEVTQGLLTLFADDRLRQFVDHALSHNPDLHASAARLEEAGFNIRKAYASTIPSLSANGGGSRSQMLLGGASSRGNRFSLALDTQWEIDVWGRIRAGVAAASRDRSAAISDDASARQSMAAQTMQAYFDQLAAEKRMLLSRRRLASFQKSYQLVNRRFEAGTGDLGELDLALTDVENTRAQLSRRRDARDQAARRLAVLTGRYPNASPSSSSRSWPSLRRGVRAGIPSDLLMRRPDIDAAYQRIRAADSRVTVAHRDLYPRFSLTASAGNQSATLKGITDSPFNVWSMTGGLVAPLLDGGRRRAELGAANARAKQALAAYQSTVLNAFREVENALGSEQYLRRQEQSTRKALTAARSAEARIRRNYESGLVEILTLLDTQRRSFDTEESLIDIQSIRSKNRVTLALALGTGL